jgi:hypothetical protein
MTAMLSHPEKGGESRDQQDKRGNGIIAERRVLESFQRELTSPSRFYQDAILVGAVQHNDPASDRRQRVKGCQHTNCDTDQFVFHHLAPRAFCQNILKPTFAQRLSMASRFGGRCFLTVAHAVTYANSLAHARAG